ncbi:protein of unknown function [Methylocaldum szegediense]|uniref:Uncharacterized protein n=1 Tax=Methylocaldum szegediense TaxID=73780 RepID=A0ABN8X6Z5_9GAMM|nr:protein of unknown function [Methylocaldum szegediense]
MNVATRFVRRERPSFLGVIFMNKAAPPVGLPCQQPWAPAITRSGGGRGIQLSHAE